MADKFTKITDEKEWQKLLDKVLFKTFFHNIEWEEFLEKEFKWLKFERYLYKNSTLLSLARVGDKLISHPFCEYGGPLPLVEKVNFDEFRHDLFSEFRTPIKISFHPYLLSYFKNGSRWNLDSSERETYFFEDLDSKTEEELWQLMDRNRHRSIKFAKEQDWQVEECQSLEDLKHLYHFYVKNLKKHRTLVYPFSFFEFFYQHPKAKILLVRHRERLIGGNVFLFYNKLVHSFLCGFDEKDKKFGAHSLLLWEAIKKFKGEGYSVFDFGGTRKNTSIGDFKKRWGAKVYPIFELKNYSGKSHLQKSKLRNIYALLPPFLIKKLSPHLLKYKL